MKANVDKSEVRSVKSYRKFFSISVHFFHGYFWLNKFCIGA